MKLERLLELAGVDSKTNKTLLNKTLLTEFEIELDLNKVMRDASKKIEWEIANKAFVIAKKEGFERAAESIVRQPGNFDKGTVLSILRTKLAVEQGKR